MSGKKLPQQCTHKKIKYKGTQDFINVLTGEITPMQLTSIEDRDFNFTKVWMRNFIMTLEIIGNKKTDVAFWVIDHLNKENQLNLTYREIAAETKTSYRTVANTMKALQDSNFLRKVGTVYTVNPDVLFKGRKQARFMVATEYNKGPVREPTTEETIKYLENSIMGLQKRLDKLKAEKSTLNGEVESQLAFNENGEIVERVKVDTKSKHK